MALRLHRLPLSAAWLPKNELALGGTTTRQLGDPPSASLSACWPCLWARLFGVTTRRQQPGPLSRFETAVALSVVLLYPSLHALSVRKVLCPTYQRVIAAEVLCKRRAVLRTTQGQGAHSTIVARVTSSPLGRMSAFQRGPEAATSQFIHLLRKVSPTACGSSLLRTVFFARSLKPTCNVQGSPETRGECSSFCALCLRPVPTVRCITLAHLSFLARSIF